MSMIRRSAWQYPTNPVIGPKADLSKIDSIVIHYPGVNPGALNLDNPVQVLRSTDLFYRSKKPVGYSIGYNFATFPSGRYELRGFDIKNAANAGHNDHTLSINCMVNGVDEMPESQLEHTRDLIEEIWERLGREVPLIRHRDLIGAATACPGAGITGQLKAGLLLPQVKPTPVQPETPPIPRPEPPTPRENLMIGIIHLTDAHAQFIGYYTGDGQFLKVHWISTQAQIDARDNHKAAGAKEFTFGKHVLRSTWVDKVPLGDGLTVWTDADFAGVE